MTVRIADNGVAELVGECSSADAETLLRHLSVHPASDVDWRECVSAHAAVVQILLAAQVRPKGPPANRFLADFVEPLLGQS